MLSGRLPLHRTKTPRLIAMLFQLLFQQFILRPLQLSSKEWPIRLRYALHLAASRLTRHWPPLRAGCSRALTLRLPCIAHRAPARLDGLRRRRTSLAFPILAAALLVSHSYLTRVHSMIQRMDVSGQPYLRLRVLLE